jgi:hypothetical protein
MLKQKSLLKYFVFKNFVLKCQELKNYSILNDCCGHKHNFHRNISKLPTKICIAFNPKPFLGQRNCKCNCTSSFILVCVDH